MTRDPIRRRFGHGAGRLRVGLPAGVERLGEVARTKVRLERRLTVVPFLTALAVIWLLATSPEIGVLETLPKPSESEIVLQPWPVPRPAPPLAEIAERPPARQPERAPEPVPSATRRASAAFAASEPARQTPPRPAFDPRSLAPRSPRPSTADVLAEAPTPTAAASTPFPTAREARARPIDLAPLASVATRSLAEAARAGEQGQPAAALAAAPGPARPTTDSASRAAGSLLEANARGARTRRSSLAALESDAAARRERGARPLAARPSVSAARAPEPLLADAAASSGGGDGWEEVPLDALPDCDPPGRQDLLKKRILLAASVQQECSHASGSYRFVETRSLGGFLMWSRPGPHAGAGMPRDRDACDVLERALACLGDRSSQESQSR